MLSIRRLIIWSIIGIGLSSIAVQILTIREFLAQFNGNEITISLSLFCWLVCTGLGSLLAKPLRRPSLFIYALLAFGLALWPLGQIIAIRVLREFFFSHGTAPGFYPVLLFIFGTLAPYGLMSGFGLPYALSLLQSGPEAFTSGDLYIRDNLGDIGGGVVFSFWLVYWATPFQALAVTSAGLLLVVLLLLWTARYNRFLGIALFLSGLFFFTALNPQLERRSLLAQYGTITDYRESPYGRIVVTREGAQHTFWEAGRPFYSEEALVKSEEKIHYPLSQLEKVRQVLLISGGLGETMVEIQKYAPRQIDYVELDPYLTALSRKLGVLPPAPNLTIINRDGRAYLREREKIYDAVIVDLPDPDTFQLNRFFTVEFMALVKQNLRPEGVFSFSLSYSSNYQSRITKQKLASAFQTARTHFKNVLALPGEEEVYFICRDGALSADVPNKLKSKNINTRYIAGFFTGTVTPDRLAGLEKSLAVQTALNRDLQPGLMQLVFQEWFLKQGTSPKIFFGLILGLAIVYLVFMKKAEYVLFSTGLVAMGTEMLVIFLFQVMYGYIYLKIGAIITAFLAGLLPGALLGKRRNLKPAESLLGLDAGLLMLLILAYIGVVSVDRHLPGYVFLVYGLVFSFLCGYQFPLVTALIGEENSPIAGCLAADLVGASVGTLLIGMLVIPLWGIRIAILFLAVVKLSSLLLVWRLKRGR